MQSTNLFIFKSATSDDLALLYKWFNHPHVQQWWPIPEKDEWLEKFLKRIRSDNTFAYIAFLDSKPLGYIQYYYIDRKSEKSGSWLPQLPQHTVGTDQFIGEPKYLRKGYGTQMVKDFINYLITIIEPTITTIIVDPDPENIIAIKCYKKVGFTIIGTFPTDHGPRLLMQYDRGNH